MFDFFEDILDTESKDIITLIVAGVLFLGTCIASFFYSPWNTEQSLPVAEQIMFFGISEFIDMWLYVFSQNFLERDYDPYSILAVFLASMSLMNYILKFVEKKMDSMNYFLSISRNWLLQNSFSYLICIFCYNFRAVSNWFTEIFEKFLLTLTSSDTRFSVVLSIIIGLLGIFLVLSFLALILPEGIHVFAAFQLFYLYSYILSFDMNIILQFFVSIFIGIGGGLLIEFLMDIFYERGFLNLLRVVYIKPIEFLCTFL